MNTHKFAHSTVYDNAQNASGYPAVMVPQPMTYDSNGNMLTIPDKGITQPIVYNYLNLPQQVVQRGNPVAYTYRADGVKVHKLFSTNGQDIETWYLDGFVYTTPYTEQIEVAFRETQDAEMMSVAGQRESFELAQKAIKDPILDPTPIDRIESAPDFFSTAEGFYDYENFMYIYQYKDHLGNARLNYGRDKSGVLFSEDRNDYYPFGLNFINPISWGPAQVYNPSATYKNYKFQGQELQETGFYSFKWRNYMPDIGRFFNVDPLAEDYPHNSTYAFSENRVIDNVELEGLEGEDFRFRLNQRLKGGVQARVEASAQKDASDSFMAVIQTVTPIEDVYSLFSGQDFDGNPVSKEQAATMLGLNFIPEVGAVEKGAIKGAVKAEATASAKAEARAAKLSKVPREGKDFTKAGKESVIDLNKIKNDGKVKCEGCGTETTKAQQSKKGVTPPKSETQVDHIKRKREGGSGTPDNGQVLCRGCNLEKH